MKILIQIGVSDLVSQQKGEAYGNFVLFEKRAEAVMVKLLEILPKRIEYIDKLP